MPLIEIGIPDFTRVFGNSGATYVLLESEDPHPIIDLLEDETSLVTANFAIRIKNPFQKEIDAGIIHVTSNSTIKLDVTHSFNLTGVVTNFDMEVTNFDLYF